MQIVYAFRVKCRQFTGPVSDTRVVPPPTVLGLMTLYFPSSYVVPVFPVAGQEVCVNINVSATAPTSDQETVSVPAAKVEGPLYWTDTVNGTRTLCPPDATGAVLRCNLFRVPPCSLDLRDRF